MKLCFYGSKSEKEDMKNIINAIPEYAAWQMEWEQYDDFECFIKALHEKLYDMIIVSENGAKGMESVIAAKEADFKTPIVWFSDDNGFGVQAFRLNVAYFAQKPFTETKVKTAFSKYIV